MIMKPFWNLGWKVLVKEEFLLSNKWHVKWYKEIFLFIFKSIWFKYKPFQLLYQNKTVEEFLEKAFYIKK